MRNGADFPSYTVRLMNPLRCQVAPSRLGKFQAADITEQVVGWDVILEWIL